MLGVLCTMHVQGHNTCAQGGGQFHTRDRRDVRGSGKAKGIRLSMLNIRSGMLESMEVFLQALKQGSVYVDVLQETKLTDGVHVRQGAGCAIWATEADSSHQGGIEVVRRK